LVGGGSGAGSSADFVVACTMPSPLCSRLDPIGRSHATHVVGRIGGRFFVVQRLSGGAADMVDATLSRRDKKGAVAMRGTLRPPIRERQLCCGAKSRVRCNRECSEPGSCERLGIYLRGNTSGRFIWGRGSKSGADSWARFQRGPRKCTLVYWSFIG
jgi:hypothetical protein